MSHSQTTPTPPPASIHGLEVRFGRTTAVGGVSFEVAEGSVLALIGRNGAGKSTIIRSLLGQIRPGRGETRLFGIDSWSGRARAMARTGVVAEQADLPPRATAASLCRLHRALYTTWSDELYAERLERFDISPRQQVARLSRGQQRQLQLALALASRPRLLVLDDPTLGLDAVARRELLEVVIETLAEQGCSILITTHDLAGIETVADHIAVLDHGRLIADEPLEQLKGRFRRLSLDMAGDTVDRNGTRPNAGTLLAALEPVRVVTDEPPGSQAEVIVSRFDRVRLDKIRRDRGITIETHGVSLEEIFDTLTSRSNGGRS